MRMYYIKPPLGTTVAKKALSSSSGGFLSHVKITDRGKCHDVFYESDGVVKI